MSKVARLPTPPRHDLQQESHLIQLLAAADQLDLCTLTEHDQAVIVHVALRLLENKLRREDAVISTPQDAKDYCRLKLGDLGHEVFMVMYLDSQHRVISSEELFRGTIDAASVYPREVVKQALAHNAAAVVFSHNHPSGVSEPSSADKQLTTRLIESLGLMGIRVLDHIVVSAVGSCSFAERGFL